MMSDQIIVFSVLAATLGLFIWNRWRYDVVALLALTAVALAGVAPPEEVFAGFGHPAVVTVVAVLVISRGLLNAGVVDALARRLTFVGERPWAQAAVLSGLVALSSGFMNNVGALALFMPVAVWMSRQSGRSPSVLLMPLAFGSLLGGMLTMIGTPPNIVIASVRRQSGSPPFGMFDFLPVGGAVALAGLAFIALVGWRLTPVRKSRNGQDDLFEIGAYLTELRVPEGCTFAGRTLHDLAAAVKDEAEVLVVGLVRSGRRTTFPSTYEVLRAEDVLIVEADPDGLQRLLDVAGLTLAEAANEEEDDEARGRARPKPEDLDLVEAILAPDATLVGRTATALDLRERYGVNVLAAARQGRRLRERLGSIRFAPGDILLVQGDKETLPAALNELGCLPLASRGLRVGKPRNIWLASGIFAAALALVASGQLPAALALVAAALAMTLTGVVAPGEIYKSVDMPVVVLLAALIPVGGALESTGGSKLIAEGLLGVARSAPPAAALALLMTAVMLLSNVINNAAAAILAAPVAVEVAARLERSADPFLMAVAIGASAAFLTPIGHQSNTLVMAPGGYKFGDYWRLGLPLSILTVAVGVPAIVWYWPL